LGTFPAWQVMPPCCKTQKMGGIPCYRGYPPQKPKTKNDNQKKGFWGKKTCKPQQKTLGCLFWEHYLGKTNTRFFVFVCFALFLVFSIVARVKRRFLEQFISRIIFAVASSSIKRLKRSHLIVF
jgi:hypothetical protein